MWDFIQDEIFGMKWLNRLIDSLLNACGLDTESKLGARFSDFRDNLYTELFPS